MGQPRKWADDAERKRAARAAAKAEGRRLPSGKSGKRKAPLPQRPFVSYDGEDIDGHYCVLAASNGACVEVEGRDITPEEFLVFVRDMARRTPKAIYVGYGSTYDWERCFLRGLTPAEMAGVNKTADLDEFDDKTWYRLRRGGWNVEVHYRPKMHLKLKLWEDEGSHKPTRVVLLDVIKHFQCSFSKTVKEWGVATEEQEVTLDYWKGLREGFTADQRLGIIRYNHLENKLLVKIMTKFRASMIEAGLRLPRSWHGPGQLAKAAYQDRKITQLLPDKRPDERTGQDKELLDIHLRAYHGGRFQCLQLGVFDHIYDYDLSSAYPAAIWLLPSERGVWHPVDCLQDSPWTVYRVQWELRGGPQYPFGPFPHRFVPAVGSSFRPALLYPMAGEGWYWHWEVAAARAIWGDQIKILAGWRLKPEREGSGNLPPEREAEGAWYWVKEQAERRVALKQSRPAQAQVLKLILNSAYGVLIQSKGKSSYKSPMLAGLITAWTRAKLLEAAATDPWSIVGFATDGVFSTRPLPLTLVKGGLGEWEQKGGSEGGEIYGSGIYRWHGKDGGKATVRSRGIPPGKVDWDQLRYRWLNVREDVLEETYTFRRPISSKQALARGKPELAGTWQEMKRTINTKSSGWMLDHDRMDEAKNPAYVPGEHPVSRALALTPDTLPLSAPYDRGLWGKLLEEVEEDEVAAVMDKNLHDYWGEGPVKRAADGPYDTGGR